MKPRSPTLEGFRIMFSRPSLGLAEISWRWSFGFAAVLILVFSLLQYLNTLPVGAGDIFLLRTRHPLLISRALAHIFAGSALRAGKAGILLMILLSAAWILVASIGRAMTVKAVMGYYLEENLPGPSAARQSRSPLGLNFLRLLVTVAAFLGFIAAFLLGEAASPATTPAPGSAILIFLVITSGVCTVWMMLNWILSLGAIIAVAESQPTLAAIVSAVELCRNRWSSILAAGTWFGLAHVVVFFIASSAAMFPLGLAGVLPFGMVLGGVLLVALLYFAASDFLYAGRMAAYVAMILPPEFFLPGLSTLPPCPPGISSVDGDELILSDVETLPAR